MGSERSPLQNLSRELPNKPWQETYSRPRGKQFKVVVRKFINNIK
jgi:hypothetical protein